MLVIPTVRRKQPWPLILRKPSCMRIISKVGALFKWLQRKNKMIDRDIRDAVSSIEITGRRTMLPGTLHGMMHVCHFRHALPKERFHTQWQRRSGLQGCTQICKLILAHKSITNIWYLGGWKCRKHCFGLCRPPLRWMVFEAGAAGLRTAPFNRERKDHE